MNKIGGSKVSHKLMKLLHEKTLGEVATTWLGRKISVMSDAVSRFSTKIQLNFFIKGKRKVLLKHQQMGKNQKDIEILFKQVAKQCLDLGYNIKFIKTEIYPMLLTFKSTDELTNKIDDLPNYQDYQRGYTSKKQIHQDFESGVQSFLTAGCSKNDAENQFLKIHPFMRHRDDFTNFISDHTKEIYNKNKEFSILHLRKKKKYTTKEAESIFETILEDTVFFKLGIKKLTKKVISKQEAEKVQNYREEAINIFLYKGYNQQEAEDMFKKFTKPYFKLEEVKQQVNDFDNILYRYQLNGTLEKEKSKCLEILELNENSTTRDLTLRYKKLSLKYHPDKNPNNPKAQEQFKEIVHAYKFIKAIFDKDK